MSRAKALLILLVFVSLVIVLIVLAAVMLAQQKGTQGNVCDGKDDLIGECKRGESLCKC